MNKDIYKAVAKHFNYHGSDAFFDVVADLVDRVDVDEFKEDESSAIYAALDEGLIYTKDQWTILEYYCSPTDANFDEAEGYLYDDICEIMNDIYDFDDEEDFDDEDFED